MSTEFVCIQCQGQKASRVLSECVDYYLRKPYRPDYFRCQNCGLLQQSPIPADVSSFYDAYPIHQSKSLLHRLMRKWVMGAAYFQTRKFLTTRQKPTVLLDYGCGDGWFLDASRSPNLQLVGFEPGSEHAARLAETLKIPIYSEPAALLRDHEGKADVVTMHFVLEHLTNLNQAFETVRRLLKPGGTFYFIIPEISSWEARLFGKKWHNLDPPRHISFPEPDVVAQLANRWGFEVDQHRGLPFPNGIAGSLPVVFTGRFSFPLFLLFLPLGIVLSRLFPSGAAGYWLRRKA